MGDKPEKMKMRLLLRWADRAERDEILAKKRNQSPVVRSKSSEELDTYQGEGIRKSPSAPYSAATETEILTKNTYAASARKIPQDLRKTTG
jgi:hypothetical protein